MSQHDERTDYTAHHNHTPAATTEHDHASEAATEHDHTAMSQDHAAPHDGTGHEGHAGHGGHGDHVGQFRRLFWICLLYTSPSPRDRQKSRMPSSA